MLNGAGSVILFVRRNERAFKNETDKVQDCERAAVDTVRSPAL
jgi:hypothetical protein